MAHLPKGQGIIPMPPFMSWLANNIPAVYDNTLSYYEELCALIKYLESTVVPAVNANAESLTIVSNALEQLKQYVDNYFDNLDVQEEINHKLDEMVESGELQRILNSPATTESIGGVIIGQGLDVDENGKIDVKAGSGITVDENGVNETPYVDYLDVQNLKYHYVDADNDTDTQVYYSIIPSTYKPIMVMSDPSDPDVGRRASKFDYRYKPTVMTNLSAWNTETHESYGPLIIDNSIKVENNLGEGTYWKRPIVGIDNDGRLHDINGSTPADEVNMKYACRAWYCLYNDGDTNPDMITTHDPRTFLAQDYDGNYLIGVCGGRKNDDGHYDTGMELVDIINFIRTEINFNARLIFSLDGGGSSNFMYKGIRQNPLVGNEDRECPNWLVFTSPTAKHDAVFEAQSATNYGLVNTWLDDFPHSLNTNQMRDMYEIAENVVLNAGSWYRKSNGLSCYSLLITVSSNLSAYTDIFTGLPAYSGIGNYYFSITNIPTTGTDVRTYLGYLKLTDGVTSLRTRFQLPAGDYQINIVYPSVF